MRSTSFPSIAAAQQDVQIFDDAMKRSVSWPGPSSKKNISLFGFEEVIHMDSSDNVLNTKFLQQVLNIQLSIKFSGSSKLTLLHLLYNRLV
jgi:hypothetical protein